MPLHWGFCLQKIATLVMREWLTPSFWAADPHRRERRRDPLGAATADVGRVWPGGELDLEHQLLVGGLANPSIGDRALLDIVAPLLVPPPLMKELSFEPVTAPRTR